MCANIDLRDRLLFCEVNHLDCLFEYIAIVNPLANDVFKSVNKNLNKHNNEI